MATRPGPVIFMSGIGDPPGLVRCSFLAKGFARAFMSGFSGTVAAEAQAGIRSNAPQDQWPQMNADKRRKQSTSSNLRSSAAM
jgi:hypothetical protein